MQPMQVIAVANHKGGVGKTATTFALGTVLAQEGRHVLLVDMDPQSSLTTSTGVSIPEGRSLAEVIGTSAEGPKLPVVEVIQKATAGVDFVPSSLTLAITELSLVARMGRESALKKVLRQVATLDRYDLVIADCPPSLGVLTINALTAAEGVIIPTQPQAVDLRGLKLFLDTLENVREELNPQLVTMGILPTFVDNRFIHHRQAIQTMIEAGLPVFESRIGRSVRVAEAAATGQSVVTYDTENNQAAAYREFGKEIARCLEQLPRH